MKEAKRSPITFFSEISKEDALSAGGKGASLGELTAAGFPVPPGFVISAALQESTAGKEISSEAQEAIFAAFDRLNADRVAVRSSATAEDSKEASWAGQFDTFLNVDREGILEAVRKCWDSARSDRVAAYAKRQEKDGEAARIAVVVQKMVDSEASGVMFTVNPVTNDPAEILIEAGYGLGETIVQGKITPDRYRIDKGTLTIKDASISSKDIQLVFRDGKNVEVPVEEALRSEPAIADNIVIVLAKLGKQIEEHYGVPQDVEWGIEDGTVYILQARPITTLGEATENLSVQTAKDPLLSGVGAAPGVAIGKVRVITELRQLDDAQEGEILVAEATTPEFTEAFGKMIAVITDTGGMASHAAIVARELAIPAVVSTGTATSALKTGDIVTVDGSAGVIYEGAVRLVCKQQVAPVEESHVVPSTGDDIDDLINSLVSDPMDTREFWPLAPGALLSYFDADQAIDMHKKVGQLLSEGWSFEKIAPLFKRAQLVRYFIVNSGLVGIKVAQKLELAPLTVEDQIAFTKWFIEILKYFQPEDPFNLKGKNAVWSDEEAATFADTVSWHAAGDKEKEVLNVSSVRLFTLNWSFYGDYYGPIGLAMHGPYQIANGTSLLVKEYFPAPVEIWGAGKKLPYQHLLVAQQYEGVDLFVNYSNRLLNKRPVAQYNSAYTIVCDGNEIDIRELRAILQDATAITQEQTEFVKSLPDMDKVRKWSQLAFYAHKEFYEHFSDQWYPKEMVEGSIAFLGDRFLKDEKLAQPGNRPIDYRKKMWDPRNDFIPG